MKEIVPQPPPLVQNELASIQALFQAHVVPSYTRFNLAFSHGAGSFSLGVMEHLLTLGFAPDIISTDLHAVVCAVYRPRPRRAIGAFHPAQCGGAQAWGFSVGLAGGKQAAARSAGR